MSKEQKRIGAHLYILFAAYCLALYMSLRGQFSSEQTFFSFLYSAIFVAMWCKTVLLIRNHRWVLWISIAWTLLAMGAALALDVPFHAPFLEDLALVLLFMLLMPYFGFLYLFGQEESLILIPALQLLFFASLLVRQYQKKQVL